MQLGNSETILELLASIDKPVRQSRDRAPVIQQPKTTRGYKAPRCARGCTCRACSDNARWERIFQEKFADPSYYTTPTSRHGSSLSDC